MFGTDYQELLFSSGAALSTEDSGESGSGKSRSELQKEERAAKAVDYANATHN